MTTLTTKRITAEEFATTPEPEDGSRDELLCGRVIFKPIARALHGFVSVNVACVVHTFVRANKIGRTSMSSGFILARNPDSVLAPDVVYCIRRDPLTDDYPEYAPDLVVEVLDFEEERCILPEKLGVYITSGVRLVWVVDPVTRTVMVYAGSTRGVEHDSEDTITGGDVLPGFACKVTDFFAD